MLEYYVLTTGSCGNSYIFSINGESIVVDIGVTKTKFLTSCKKFNIPLSGIKGILLTHLHPDHARGTSALCRELGLKVYISKDTYERGYYLLKKLGIKEDSIVQFNFDESFTLSPFRITPFHTYHDSPGSTGYFIESEEGNIFLLTDTGRVPDGVFSYARDSKLKFIESNYDQNMLDTGPYPEVLRRRISGLYGHLENKEAIDFTKRVSREGDWVYFVHLSSNNNKSEIVSSLIKEEISTMVHTHVLERGEEACGSIEEF